MNVRGCAKDVYLAWRNFLLMLCPRAPERQMSKPSSIVAIRIDRIGDLVVSLPTIKAMKTLFPEARITVLARKPALALLEGLEWIDEKIPYHGFWKTIRVLRRRRFSLAVDLLMDYTLKTALIAYLSGAAVTAGFDIASRGKCFTISVTPSRDKLRMYQHTLGLARAIAGFYNIEASKIREDAPQLLLSRENKKAAQDFLQAKGIREGMLAFGIHPGAKFPSQRWQPEKFAQLSDIISGKYNAKIFIIGSNQENALVRKIAGLMKTQPIFAVGFTLGRLAAIIARMDLLICNNSGLLHIAAALGVGTVSMMGPTEPQLWRPAGKDSIVIRRGLSCSPCSKAVCRSHQCMNLITVDEVWEGVRNYIEHRGHEA